MCATPEAVTCMEVRVEAKERQCLSDCIDEVVAGPY